MITIFVHENGLTRSVDRVDPAWLTHGQNVVVWVDLEAPSPEEGRVLTDVFRFHELAIEDALTEIHNPKVETYDGYFYLVLHGIDFQASQHKFATRDVDFFLGPNFLVTVRQGESRSVGRVCDLVCRNQRMMGEGSAALLHRIVDAMVDNYRPEVEKLEDRLDEVEKEVFATPSNELVRTILDLKRDVGSLRRVTLPQRDVVNRLARREFPLINEQIGYRFRDVYDHLVRLSDQAMTFQDRITGVLDAYLSTVSNRLNEVMKVLTVIATIFMPLTVLTGVFGMNVTLPTLPGGEEAQFWWICGLMSVVVAVMMWFFRRRHWI